MPEKESQNRNYAIIVSEDWLNSNLVGGIESIRNVEEVTRKNKEKLYYRCILFLLFIMMALPLNLIFFAWVYCTEDIFHVSMGVQSFVFYFLAKQWNIDKEVASVVSSTISLVKKFPGI